MNSLVFFNPDETVDTLLKKPIQLIKDTAITCTRDKCGYHYAFNLSSLSFNHLQFKECSLDITPSLESKINLVEIKKFINESENVRNINFYFQMS
ncbi:hypothetical protein DICPUDRAFT_158840 [Dictyostelium purpureum]|uniref:Uncharacterized protein n=1 Tax=Dictyostelium purpureum TaxID=5786 RepID=F1A2M1_DICPU|nr:uncharacterized protein DICPUDRAFT_158840 [Dictyostelium purpureum]EGC29566.1 hypothetical protein DICPUDRAFT_158840 [Dictyostelium purpureum]|eukprot:XP_003293915.1 hypothetical protein DICPUDRAFT_158840 [Dictyostelium purpureum]